MNLAAKLLCAIAFISVLSQFGKTILELSGITNIIPIIRDTMLFCLTILAVSRSKLFENKYFFGAILSFYCIIIINIIIAVVDGHIYAGFYYSRIYLLPMIFALASYGLIIPLKRGEIFLIARFIYNGGALLIASSIAIYSAVEFNPIILHSLMGGEQIPLAHAWSIAGSMWKRMGLPATSPNSLGLIVCLYILFLISIKFSGLVKEIGCTQFKFVVLCSFSVLLMTLSRSSWLACFIGSIVILYTSHNRWNLRIHFRPITIIGFLFGGTGFTVLLLMSLDNYSNGAITNWAQLNFSGTDSSMIGHKDSFIHAWDSLDKYILLGYPKGSVGPKALLFRENFFNVENSIIGIFYDMGVPIGIAFMITIGFILRGIWLDRIQASILIAFLLSSQFLPFVFESDIIIFFLMIYVILGRLISYSEKSSNLLDVTIIHSSNGMQKNAINTFKI